MPRPVLNSAIGRYVYGLMLRNIRLVCLVSCCALLMAPLAQARSAAPERALADSVAKALVAGDFDVALAHLHHPPLDYDARRARDRARVEASLGRLLEQFGPVGRLRYAPDPAAYFEASVGAGNAAYWRANRPARARDYVYFGRFRNYGPGFVIVRVMTARGASAPELQRVGFGTPSNAASTQRSAAMMRALFEADELAERER